jgi:hypothetical protein
MLQIAAANAQEEWKEKLNILKISLDVVEEKKKRYVWDAEILSGISLDIEKELCACFVYWQKTSDHVN